MSQKSSTLLTLPTEILDLLCANVDDRHDLISLATTSHSLADIILPRHIQYRVIRLCGRRREVWAHLAQRADLAANVRQLHLVEDPKYFSRPERVPDTLAAQDGEGEPENAHNMSQALRNMVSLDTLIWIQPSASEMWSQGPECYEGVLNALGQLQALKNLIVFDMSPDVRFETALLRSMSGLDTLRLEGGLWRHLYQSTDFSSLLARCPKLQSLSLNMVMLSARVLTCRSTGLLTCQLPFLKKLSLSGGAYLAEFSDDVVLRFLEAHTSLEELTWFPLAPASRLVPGSLPNLKRLETRHDFAMTIIKDKTVRRRKLESLGWISFLDWSCLGVLEESIDGLGLRELRMANCDSIETLHRVAKMFPALVTLELSYNLGTMDSYIDALSSFKSLEHLIDTSLWGKIQGLDAERRKATVKCLADRCPLVGRLRRVDGMTGKRMDVFLTRGSDDVTWEEREIDRRNFSV